MIGGDDQRGHLAPALVEESRNRDEALDLLSAEVALGIRPLGRAFNAAGRGDKGARRELKYYFSLFRVGRAPDRAGSPR